MTKFPWFLCFFAAISTNVYRLENKKEYWWKHAALPLRRKMGVWMAELGASSVHDDLYFNVNTQRDLYDRVSLTFRWHQKRRMSSRHSRTHLKCYQTERIFFAPCMVCTGQTWNVKTEGWLQKVAFLASMGSSCQNEQGESTPSVVALRLTNSPTPSFFLKSELGKKSENGQPYQLLYNHLSLQCKKFFAWTNYRRGITVTKPDTYLAVAQCDSNLEKKDKKLHHLSLTHPKSVVFVHGIKLQFCKHAPREMVCCLQFAFCFLLWKQKDEMVPVKGEKESSECRLHFRFFPNGLEPTNFLACSGWTKFVDGLVSTQVQNI